MLVFGFICIISILGLLWSIDEKDINEMKNRFRKKQ